MRQRIQALPRPERLAAARVRASEQASEQAGLQACVLPCVQAGAEAGAQASLRAGTHTDVQASVQAGVHAVAQASVQARAGGRSLLVLDTNIVLDLLVFADPSVQALHQALEARSVLWLATAPMRSELERVLGYAHIAARTRAADCTATEVLAHFQRLSERAEAAAPASVRCSDRDDQIFVDLALAHGACLLSKDHAVLRLRRPLERMGAQVRSTWCAA